MIELFFGRAEIIVGKGKNAGNAAFSPFPTMNSESSGVVKTQDDVIELYVPIFFHQVYNTLWKVMTAKMRD